jgi:hypothetical protein
MSTALLSLIGLWGGMGLKLGLSSVKHGSSYDSDASNFFANIVANGGTISTATKGYINTFVLGLKAAGLWSYLVEIYPFVGDQIAAAVTKLKCVNNIYLTAHNYVSADYSETGSGAGIKGDGTSKYLDTNLPTNNGVMTAANAGMGFYRTAFTSDNNQCDMGMIGDTFTTSYWTYLYNLELRYSNASGTASANVYNTTTGFVTSEVNSSNTNSYLNGSSVVNTTPGGTYPDTTTYNMYVSAINNGGSPGFFSDYTYGFAFQSLYLGPTQQSALYTLVEELQNSLRRNA